MMSPPTEDIRECTKVVNSLNENLLTVSSNLATMSENIQRTTALTDGCVKPSSLDNSNLCCLINSWLSMWVRMGKEQTRMVLEANKVEKPAADIKKKAELPVSSSSKKRKSSRSLPSGAALKRKPSRSSLKK